MTLEAWERLRFGVRKLLLVYNAKVCEHCCEVHVGPTGHEVRTCGMYKYGAHMWRHAEVDDIVPQNIVWHSLTGEHRILLCLRIEEGAFMAMHRLSSKFVHKLVQECLKSTFA